MQQALVAGRSPAGRGDRERLRAAFLRVLQRQPGSAIAALAAARSRSEVLSDWHCSPPRPQRFSLQLLMAAGARAVAVPFHTGACVPQTQVPQGKAEVFRTGNTVGTDPGSSCPLSALGYWHWSCAAFTSSAWNVLEQGAVHGQPQSARTGTFFCGVALVSVGLFSGTKVTFSLLW